MNNLKCLKQGFNKYVCKHTNKEIKLSDCKNCPYKEYKVKEHKQMKQKTNELAKLERNRSSLFTNDNTKCMFCPSTYHLTWHEIYRGRNRQNSMKYKLCLRMCDKCHDKYQENIEFNNYWHKKGQAAFNATYPDLKFEDVFGINHLD